MKFQPSAFTRIKLQIIPIILTATFLLLNSTPGQALWGEKIKTLDSQDLEQIAQELRLYDDPSLPRYNDIFNSYYRDPKELLNALNAKIEIDQKIYEIARVAIHPKDLDGLTYGMYILNAINEKRLVERTNQENFTPGQADGKFFGKLADDLADWKSQLSGSTVERFLQGVSATIGLTSLGLSSGISTLHLAADLVVIGLSIDELNKVLFENALCSYILFRKNYNYEHEDAWEQYAESRIDQIVVLSPKKKEEMKEAIEEFFWSLWMRYQNSILSGGFGKYNFEIKQRKQLKMLLLYALGAKAHPVISAPLKITPVASSYQEGDKIKAEFTIKNRGNLPIFLKTLTVGGRHGDKQEVTDFTHRKTTLLDIDGSYNYQGALTLLKTGKYHFFCAYQTPDGEWNTSVDLTSGLTDEDRIQDITVKTEAAQDPEANKLYVEANQLITLGWQAESYSEALALYKKALTKLETIISTYSSSYVAVEVVKENTINDLKYEILPWAILRADAEKSPFACAFYLIKKWTDEFDELSSVATKYANIGQKEKALKILDELLSKAKGISDSEDRVSALGTLATRYAEIGEFSQALRTLDQNGSAYVVATLPKVVIALPTEHADLDQLDKVLDAVRATDWPYSQDWARVRLPALQRLIKIADRYAELGQEDQAEQTLAEAFVGARKSPELLIEIASKYAELSQKSKALEVLQKAFEAIRATGPWLFSTHRSSLWGKIATVYAELGEKGKAAEVLAEAAESVSRPKYYGLIEMASKSIDLGLTEEALKVPEAASDSGEEALILIEIASKFIKLGQKDKAKEALNKALRTAPSIGVICSIASKYAELDEENKARELVSIALDRYGEDTARWRNDDWLLVNLALQFLSLGEPERAFEIVEKIEWSYGKRYWEGKDRAYLKIANKYIELGQLEKALEIERRWGDSETLAKIANKYTELGQLEKALEITEKIKESTKGYRIQTLAKIVNKYIELGQLERALEVAEERVTSLLDEIAFKYLELGQPDKAFEVAKKMPIKYPKLLGDIAVKYAQLGQPEQTYDIIKRIWDRKRPSSKVDDALDKVATTWAQLGKFEEALEMVEKISSEARQAKTLMEIDLRYAELAQEVKEDEKKILHGIVRDAYRK